MRWLAKHLCGKATVLQTTVPQSHGRLKALLRDSLLTVCAHRSPLTSHLVPNGTLFDICGSALRIAVVLAFARSARRSREAGELLGRANTQHCKVQNIHALVLGIFPAHNPSLHRQPANISSSGLVSRFSLFWV